MNKTYFLVGIFCFVAFAVLVAALASDTDGGFNIYEQGTCTDDFGNYTDSCIFGGTSKVSNLKEWYPTNDTNSSVCTYEIVNCKDYDGAICSGGRCIIADLDILSLDVAINDTNESVYQVTLTAEIKNKGTANAGSSTTRFNVSPSGGEMLVSTASINAGQTVYVSAVYDLSEDSNYTATADADWYDVVPESNEANNGALISFSVP